MPQVSVIIPVFNTEKYLKKCLESVCNQTLSDIEIICINDCSPDNSLEILREYAQKDDRIKIIDFKENKGVSIARNKGIDEAKGEYIGFVDSDDFVDLDFYEKLYNKAVETGADAVKGNILNFNPQTEESKISDFYDMNKKIKDDFSYFYYGFTAAIYNNDFIKKHNIDFPEQISYFEDPYFSIKAVMYYKKVEIVNTARYFYTQYPCSLSKNLKTLEQVYDIGKSINYIKNFLNKSEVSKNRYLVVYKFIYRTLLNLCACHEFDDDKKAFFVDNMIELLKECRYDEEKNSFWCESLKLVPSKFVFKFLRLNTTKMTS